MNRKKLILVLGMVFVVTLSLLIAGCHHRSSPEAFRSSMVDKISSELTLDQSQKEQLTAITVELLTKAKEMRQNKEAAHREILTQIQSDKIDTALIKGHVHAKMTDIEGLIDLAVDRLAAFHATLSPDQRAKLVEMMKEWEAKARNHEHFPMAY